MFVVRRDTCLKYLRELSEDELKKILIQNQGYLDLRDLLKRFKNWLLRKQKSER